MKQFFTLVFVIILLSAEAQVGTIYRLIGTPAAGSISVTSAGTTGSGFRRSGLWQVISSTSNPSLVGSTTQNPTSGATLQIFDDTLVISNSNIDLSSFVFNIQIRSEGTSATTQRVGMLHLNDQSLTLGTGSAITLGWGIATHSGVVYFYPGYIQLQDNSADIIIGSTTIASTGNGRSSYYLNANAYNVSNSSGTRYDLSIGAPSASHIMSGINAPTANITNKTVALTNPYFSVFPYFYNATTGAGGSNVAPLPVQLISFNATKANSKVVLNWATAQEINSDYFEVQRSTDATNWVTVSTVKAAGNSGNIRNYKTEDAAATGGNVYYRIKMVDNDATFAYSNIARLSFAAATGKLIAYPNPASSYTVISSDKNLMGKVSIEAINTVTGVRAMQQVVNNPGNTFRINTNELTPGNYLIRISNEAGVADVLKLSKF